MTFACSRNRGFEFDHGAQFFTAKSPRFSEFLEPLVDAGVVSVWSPRVAELDRDRIAALHQWDSSEPHYVGAPRMNSIGKHLAADLDVRRNTTVARLVQQAQRWLLFDSEGQPLGEHDWVVLAAPAPQTLALIPDSAPLIQQISATRMIGCFTLMIGLEQPLDLSWDAAYVERADIGWIAVNSGKPARPEPYCLVVHSTNAWAESHMGDDLESVKRHLLSESASVLGETIRDATYCGLHRWRYANCEPQPGDGFGFDEQCRIAACGDWFAHGRVEEAFTSAVQLVESLKRCC
jgi:renalase